MPQGEALALIRWAYKAAHPCDAPENMHRTPVEYYQFCGGGVYNLFFFWSRASLPEAAVSIAAKCLTRIVPQGSKHLWAGMARRIVLGRGLARGTG